MKGLMEETWTLKLLPCYPVCGIKDEDGKFYLNENHLHYFQAQTGMAVSGFNNCDFVTYMNKGILIVTINFNANYWKLT